MNILQEIAEKRRIAIENKKQVVSLEAMKERAEQKAAEEREKGGFSFLFEKSLSKEGIQFICEVKKASPSKGVIVPAFPYRDIALAYEQAGAAAISVLTEPEYFLGKDEYLEEIAKAVSLPVLRKDFTIDPFQIYEAKLLGASAVLLICSLLKPEQLEEFLGLVHKLGMSALVEAHDDKEVKQAVEAGSRIIGINNRDLKTFQVDIRNSVRLRRLVPEDILFVSESGICSREDVELLQKNGTDAVLIGETLMRSQDKKKMLEKLKGTSG
ncbi:MAG: indole-3-glycerol phosphate synthase TrpC [Lachnospiraceae bacterium]|nr:indole-3-glycerol phosphate synthase TrpC [Lachnospiraceae bacterium]